MRCVLTALIVVAATAVVVAATPRPGWLGFGFTFHADAQPWLHVRQVIKGSPADAAGLRSQDIIRQINGKAIAFANTNEARQFFAGLQPRDVIAFRVRRLDGERTIRITAAEMPEAYYRLWKSNEDAPRRR